MSEQARDSRSRGMANKRGKVYPPRLDARAGRRYRRYIESAKIGAVGAPTPATHSDNLSAITYQGGNRCS